MWLAWKPSTDQQCSLHISSTMYTIRSRTHSAPIGIRYMEIQVWGHHRQISSVISIAMCRVHCKESLRMLALPFRLQLKVQHGWWLSADYVYEIKNAFVKCITLLNFNFNFNAKPWSHNNFVFAISVAAVEIKKMRIACSRCISLIYYIKCTFDHLHSLNYKL